MKSTKLVWLLWCLVALALISPMVYTRELLFPFITSKALFFRFFILLTLPLYGFLIVKYPKLRPQWNNPVTLSLTAFLLISIATAFTGLYPTRSLWGNYERMTGVFYLFTLVLLYFYALMLGASGGRPIRKFLQWLIAVSVALTVYGILVRLGVNGFFPDPSGPRISSMFGNPIFFASFLIFPITLSLYFAAEAEKVKKRWIYIGLAIFQFIGLFLTQTRGALVGVIAGIGVGAITWVWFNRKSSHGKRGVWVLVILVVLAAGLFGLGSLGKKGTTIYRITHLRDTNTSARLVQWKIALRGFKEHPLLGVGSENYLYIGNKYYDPELYKYDRSWFDKPHNYPLEVLVTNGVFGFAAYLLLFVFSIWSVWRAFRNELLSSMEASILIGGIIAYQIQNLFVFDTVGPSVVFYAFTGFIGFLWDEAKRKEVKRNLLSASWALPVLVVLSFLVIYGMYITIYLTYHASLYVNYGYAYGKVDVQKAYSFFEDGKKVPFNFDYGELASKYGEFAAGLVNQPEAAKNKAIVNSCLDGSIEALEVMVKRSPYNTIYWYQLAISYTMKASFNGQPFDSRASDAIERAVELAPNKLEIVAYSAQILSMMGRNDKAVEVMQRLADLYPTSSDTRWRLGLAFASNNEYDRAFATIKEALDLGYVMSEASELDWLVNSYGSQNEWKKLFEVYDIVLRTFPKDTKLLARVAKAYAASGDFEKAKLTAQKILEIEPKAQKSVDQFLGGIPSTTPSIAGTSTP